MRAAILAADNPTQVRKWLHASSAGQVLVRLATKETALSHDALDALGTGDASIGHLRALLVAANALPEEDRSINRLEAFAAALVKDVHDAGDRKVIRAWLRWQVLPRLRARHESGQSMAHSTNNARSALRQVTAFVQAWRSAAGRFEVAHNRASTTGSQVLARSGGWPDPSWRGPLIVPTSPETCESRPAHPSRFGLRSTASSAGRSLDVWWWMTPSTSPIVSPAPSSCSTDSPWPESPP